MTKTDLPGVADAARPRSSTDPTVNLSAEALAEFRVPPEKDPAQEPIFRFYKYDHLPPDLQTVSKRFHDLADWVIRNAPRNAERTAGLRKILEGKDAIVRAFIPDPKDRKPEGP